MRRDRATPHQRLFREGVDALAHRQTSAQHRVEALQQCWKISSDSLAKDRDVEASVLVVDPVAHPGDGRPCDIGMRGPRRRRDTTSRLAHLPDGVGDRCHGLWILSPG